jgi:GNAT superfamily N-acetyltransferase
MFVWSPLDEKRFGLKTAKLSINSSCNNISEQLTIFKREQGRLFIVRCDTGLSDTIFKLQTVGFFTTDTMLTFSISPDFLVKQDFKTNSSFEVVQAQEKDSDILASISRKAFAGYCGHYHNNPGLDKNHCDEVYVDWARNLVLNKSMADVVYMCRLKEFYTGFASLKVNAEGMAKAGLLGVVPSQKGKGISRLLHQKRFQWCIDNGIKEIQVETSINNKVYLNLLIGLGFKYVSAVQIFHLNNF